jgi:hypothetical protein
MGSPEWPVKEWRRATEQTASGGSICHGGSWRFLRANVTSHRRSTSVACGSGGEARGGARGWFELG